MTRLLGLVAAGILLAVSSAGAVPTGFSITDVTTIPGDPQVTSMAWAPDGSNRLFVTGKEGQVWIIEDGSLLGETFIRLVPRIGDTGELITSSECGLLSIAFDPDFVRNGFVYVFATLNPGTGIEQQILRFTAVGDRGMDRRVIVRGLASRGANHDGGTMAFGPDGLLYWAVGDNGNGTGVGNDTVSSAAKVGRAPAIPDAPAIDGPFDDGSGPNFDYIFARGFRNPYTMTFDPARGDLWVNVVGTSWEQIFVVGEADHVGYPMENVEPGAGGFTTLAPVLVYPTGGGTPRDIGGGGAVRAGGTITFTTSGDHGLRRGNEVVVAGIDDTTFNGTFTITAVPSLRSFQVADADPDAESGNGTANHGDYGNVVLGGTFYDASQFPEEYRGSFFFGDFGQGNFQRVRLDGAGNIVAVDRFHTGLGSYIDAATGPDGALYTVRHGGQVQKITWNAAAGIVVSPLNLQLSEGGRGVVTVSLGAQPAGAVTLSVARSSGDADLSVMSGASLSFNGSNWQTPQTVTLAAAVDGDSTGDTAAFTVSGGSLAAQAFTVRAAEPVVVAGPPPTDGGLIGLPGDGGTTGGSDGGCDCRTGRGVPSPAAVVMLAIAALFVVGRRRGPRA